MGAYFWPSQVKQEILRISDFILQIECMLGFEKTKGWEIQSARPTSTLLNINGQNRILW
jgi:hypothetical protein